MAHDGPNESFGITPSAKDIGAGEWMLIGCGKHFVVEVVKQSD
jgi:hypothetical protein